MPSKHLPKRFFVVAYDVLALSALCLLFSACMPQVAYAYVDPSVMTYTIQALAGVAVALSAVAGVAFRRTRRALLKLLKIDENANKLVEDDVIRVSADESNLSKEAGTFVLDDVAQTDRDSKEPGKQAKSWKLGWPKRFVISFFVALFAFGTVLIVAPYELIAASEGSLIYGLQTVWQPIAIFGAAVVAVAIILLSLFRGRAFFVIICIVFSLGLCCWAQALFMNGGLPLANGAVLNLFEHKRMVLLSTVVWLALLIIPLVVGFHFKRHRAVQASIVAISVALIVVQGVGVASLFMNAVEEEVPEAEAPLSSYVMTREGINSVSGDKHNVVVFVLDTVDTQFLVDATNAHPEMLDEFTGFTWFQNSVGSMVPTRYGNIFLLTGVMPEYGEDWEHFRRRRYVDNAYLHAIRDAGYSVGVYTDSMGVEWATDEETRDVYDTTFNVRPLTREERTFNPEETVKILVKCALYRDAPWALKPLFWFYTDEVNRAMVKTNIVETGNDNEPYVIDDAKWLDDLQENGISLDDPHATEGSFRYIHLLGTHWPYSLNEVGDFVGTEAVTLDQQTQGTMFGVSEYLRLLKKSGVYDETTIIVTADHGEHYPVYDGLKRPASPIMIVKPAQSAELDALPLYISRAPVQASDVLATVLDSMGNSDEAAKYGIPVFDIPEDMDRPRRFLATMFNRYDVVHDGDILEYDINGYVLDMRNWQLTGEVWNHIDYN